MCFGQNCQTLRCAKRVRDPVAFLTGAFILRIILPLATTLIFSSSFSLLRFCCCCSNLICFLFFLGLLFCIFFLIFFFAFSRAGCVSILGLLLRLLAAASTLRLSGSAMDLTAPYGVLEISIVSILVTPRQDVIYLIPKVIPSSAIAVQWTLLYFLEGRMQGAPFTKSLP